MQCGLQFFPTVSEDQKSGKAYFKECLDLVELCDGLGFSHVRTVEHYFHPYGGYSPNPIVMLSAASQRCKHARLITGAVLPVFNNPLKLAGEIGMLDAISNGRLEVGFARAFLPHEFRRFGISLDESKDRFTEGLEQVRLLLEQENVTSKGSFHRFEDTTSLPRPTQKPRPPFWIAATSTPESFSNAGKLGHSIMAIPIAGGKLRDQLGAYRSAWKEAGHPGKGRVMLAFHAFCWTDDAEARSIARAPIERYMKRIVEAGSDWGSMSSKDYPGYDKLMKHLKQETFDTLLQSRAVLVGTPGQILEQIHECQERTGGFEIASLQFNFDDLPYDLSSRSAKLFGEKVLPRLPADPSMSTVN